MSLWKTEEIQHHETFASAPLAYSTQPDIQNFGKSGFIIPRQSLHGQFVKIATFFKRIKMAYTKRPNFHKIVWHIIILVFIPLQMAWSHSIPENADLPESIQIGGLYPSLTYTDKDFTFLGNNYRVRWYSDYAGKEYPIITHLPDPGDLLKEEVIMDANLLETLFLFKKLFPANLPLGSHYQPYLDFQSGHWESKKEYWEKMVEVWDPNDADWMIGGLYVCNLAASIVLATAGHPTGLLSGVAALGGVISMTKETLNFIENMSKGPAMPPTAFCG
jgi:hypothetical protein